MKIIINEVDFNKTVDEEEVKTFHLPALREGQYLADEIVRRRREFAIDAVILEGLKFMGTHEYIVSPNSRPHYIDQRAADSLDAAFNLQNEIDNPPSFEVLSIPQLRAARVHQLSRDAFDNATAIICALFNDPSPSGIEDSDNPFQQD